MHYLELLDRLHAATQPAVYLEIGVEFGNSLILSRSRSVAVDPAPQLRPEALAGKPWVKLYQQPSDDFFRTHTKESTLEGHPLDLAFIDGLHQFAQVVRDLEHVEQWGHPGTVVVIHDVLPRGTWEATRARHGTDWVGDVWRIVAFLGEHRPDLTCHLIDAKATGVLVITGVDPAHRAMRELAEAHDREFPTDGDTYDRLVEAYLREARPESAEAFVQSVPGQERPVGHRIEVQGWVALPATGAFQPLPDAAERSLRISLSQPARCAFRIRLALAVRGMEVLRIGLNCGDGDRERERNVFLDVARPGALHHELERVALSHNAARNGFELELEGTLLPGEELRALRLHPADADLKEVSPADDMTIGLQRVEVAQVVLPSAVVRFAPDRLEDRPRPARTEDRPHNAVVFAWFVPDRMPELGEYYLNLLRYHHFDAKIFIGMNHGSDPAWEKHIRESGLDAEIRWARPEVEDYWDTTGFLTALAAYAESEKSFALIWFGHSKGASQATFADYRSTRFALERNFWARRGRVERIFADAKIGIFAPRFSPLPTGFYGDELPALLRIYRGQHAPIGLHAKETFFVMRDAIVRTFCREVGADFFRTPPGSYGAGRYFFEIGFPSIASMQGYEPFIDPDVSGEDHPRDDVWLSFDPKQNHRLAAAELERWRRDSIGFEPRAMRELWDPVRP